MANTRDIRRRIKSVKNTSQITKAMQMVAASKMRKAQQTALDGRPFANLLNHVLSCVQERTDASLHPLLQERDVKKELVIVISTDKGLCGGLNTNIFREVNKLKCDDALFVAAGRKGKQYLARTGCNLIADFELSDAPTFLEAKRISQFCMDKFLDGEIDRLRVIYPYFVNTLVQESRIRQILPVSSFDVTMADDAEDEDVLDGSEYIFEPDPKEVLNALVPYYVHTELHQMILNARASEHSARMVAMKSATENANGLIKDLTLEYNKLRQAAITTELLEITTAQMALG